MNKVNTASSLLGMAVELYTHMNYTTGAPPGFYAIEQQTVAADRRQMQTGGQDCSRLLAGGITSSTRGGAGAGGQPPRADSTYCRKFGRVYGGILVTVGIPLNIITILTLNRDKQSRRTTRFLMVLLCLMDIAVLAVACLRYWLLSVGLPDLRLLSESVCKLHGYLSAVATDLALTALCGIAVERLLVVAVPHRVRTLVTLRSVALVSGFVLVATFLKNCWIPVTYTIMRRSIRVVIPFIAPTTSNMLSHTIATSFTAISNRNISSSSSNSSVTSSTISVNCSMARCKPDASGRMLKSLHKLDFFTFSVIPYAILFSSNTFIYLKLRRQRALMQTHKTQSMCVTTAVGASVSASATGAAGLGKRSACVQSSLHLKLRASPNPPGNASRTTRFSPFKSRLSMIIRNTGSAAAASGGGATTAKHNFQRRNTDTILVNNCADTPNQTNPENLTNSNNTDNCKSSLENYQTNASISNARQVDNSHNSRKQNRVSTSTLFSLRNRRRGHRNSNRQSTTADDANESTLAGTALEEETSLTAVAPAPTPSPLPITTIGGGVGRALVAAGLKTTTPTTSTAPGVTSSAGSRRKPESIIKVLSALIIVHAVTTLPGTVYQLAKALFGERTVQTWFNHVDINECLMYFIYTNNTFNFVTFMLSSSVFRKNFLNLMRCNNKSG